MVFDPYERYESTSTKTAYVTGDDLLHALMKMVDRMGLYFDSDEILEEGMTPKEVIERIEDSNGDGCDFIRLLQNVTTGETYISSYYEEDEEW